MPTDIISDNSTGTYTQTYGGAGQSLNTYFRENLPTTVYYDSGEIHVAKESSGGWRNALVSFPGLSNITGPVTVSSATIYMDLNGTSGDSVTWTLKRLLLNWGETTACWSYYTGTTAWNTAGGVGDGSDRSATTSATATDGISTGWIAFTGAQLATDVQNIINGSVSNYGWHFERTDGSNDGIYHIFTSNDGTNGVRPALSVTYTAGGGSSASLLLASSNNSGGF